MPQLAQKKTRDPDAFGKVTAELVNDFRTQRPIRAGSLLISVFGDAIAPHGGTVWLGSLIQVLEGFGVNQRLVRTSVFRLVKDGWLTTEQIGRRSYYSLTAEGRRRFQDASRRIYGAPGQEWSGDWTMILLSGVETTQREPVRKILRWLGFAPFSANLMAHPAADMPAVHAQLGSLGDRHRLLTMHTRIDAENDDYLRQLVIQAWELDALGARYSLFLERFRPAYQAARGRRQLDPERAFQLRTLLVHEYRKILLRDPLLPEALLPSRWAGVSAYRLCRNLYSLVAQPTERFLVQRMETADGPLPPAEAQYFQRFGGLADSQNDRTGS